MPTGGPSPSRHTIPRRKRNDAAGKPRSVGGSSGSSGTRACAGLSPHDRYRERASCRHTERRMTQSLVDLLLHLDQHLDLLFAQMGMWTYAVIFLIVFAETGLVVTPFLPGDSLLFATGALAARGLIPPIVLGALLSAAAIAGDTVNYWIGQAAGPRVFRQEHSRFFKREYLDRTQRFFERYGSLTIVLARFVPIVRTFAPFVAGIGRMAYGRFLFYNVVGGIVWVTAFVAIGYFFGNLPVVRQHFSLAIGVVIVLSGVPILVELWRHRRRSSANEDFWRKAGV